LRASGASFIRGYAIKEIVPDLHMSRNAVRKRCIGSDGAQLRA
jgi:hypothetical protein